MRRHLSSTDATPSASAETSTFDPVAASMNRASTDMGNVSQVVNAIHPYIGVGGEASNHQQAFAAACVGPAAERALRQGALALAWTAFDVGCLRKKS